jgi:hypothetical protein
MADHGARAHSTWSASATARNWNCPGALTLAAKAGPDRPSEAAAWGTACHEIAEKCLLDGSNAAEHTDDEEMAETAQTFIDYVRGRMKEHDHGEGATLYVEQQFSLADLNPPFDAGGTGDAVMWFPAWKLLEIVDLKGGRGVVVEAKGNPQMRTYALGAMLMVPGLDIERVTTTIVQPRAPHKDGRIRSETFHVADLVEWTADLLNAMRHSKTAYDLFQVLDEQNLSRAEWDRDFLHAGDHCKFCPAAGFCPALEQRALDAAGVWFDDLDQPRLSNAPDSMDAAEIAKKLDMLDMITEWVNALRAYAHAQAELGVEIPGYQLVDKVGNRAWKFDVEGTSADLRSCGLTDYEIFTPPKLKTPAQIEKVLGAKRKSVLDNMVERPARGTNLVAVTKTSRPAATPAVSKHFQPIEG